ncbi:MAG: DUF2911 domain-containing protein [Salibacteraceae bacterium]
MKKYLLLSLVCIGAYSFSFGQTFPGLDKSPMDVAYYPHKATKRAFVEDSKEQEQLEPKIRVLYSRPAKKGRDIFGGLVKYGETWRVGANETTEIQFFTDVMFGDTKVKAGRYTLVAVPTADSWTLHLNTDLDGWGHYAHNADRDVATVTVKTQATKQELETLAIFIAEKSPGLAHLTIGWDRTMVEVPIKLL